MAAEGENSDGEAMLLQFIAVCKTCQNHALSARVLTDGNNGALCRTDSFSSKYYYSDWS